MHQHIKVRERIKKDTNKHQTSQQQKVQQRDSSQSSSFLPSLSELLALVAGALTIVAYFSPWTYTPLWGPHTLKDFPLLLKIGGSVLYQGPSIITLLALSRTLFTCFGLSSPSNKMIGGLVLFLSIAFLVILVFVNELFYKMNFNGVKPKSFFLALFNFKFFSTLKKDDKCQSWAFLLVFTHHRLTSYHNGIPPNEIRRAKKYAFHF